MLNSDTGQLIENKITNIIPKTHSARIRTGRIIDPPPFLGRKRTRIKSSNRKEEDEEEAHQRIPPKEPKFKRHKPSNDTKVQIEELKIETNLGDCPNLLHLPSSSQSLNNSQLSDKTERLIYNSVTIPPDIDLTLRFEKVRKYIRKKYN